ncbi:hypothetical protein [Salininema proteolyticum]|uniref:DUF3137 domain-containing protein n=1 Tax=Salininema proteolyticum TaxID=1607685 RepID=A0ABV8TSV8_9ACTN
MLHELATLAHAAVSLPELVPYPAETALKGLLRSGSLLARVRGGGDSYDSDDDDDGMSFIIFVIMILLAGGLFWLFWWLRQKKIREYRAWAAQYGYHYEPSDNSVVNFSTGDPFQEGRGRTGQDVFRGQYRGMHVIFFQYNYTTGSGKNSETHYNQVVAIGLPAPRPRLDIGHEGWFSRKFQKDIDFENQAFNDRYRIMSENRRFAFDIIHARTMEWMMADQRALSNQWRFEGPWLMTWRAGELNLQEVFPYLDFLIDVYAQVPRFVWANH